jgi:redox-sensing transcriptional repressor
MGSAQPESGRKQPVTVSESSIQRLSRYYRTLESAAEIGIKHISSSELASSNKVTSAQVRKDLSTFGTFGRRGLGYSVEELKMGIADILGLNRRYNVVLVGIGNIGRALLDFGEFRRRGFDIVAGFDIDPKKVGSKRKGVDIYHEDDFQEIVKKLDVDIGIIAVPAANAQDVCDAIIKSGIRAILTFAPIRLHVPENVAVRYEDMTIELESLSFALANG